jgi:hypothetical protein
VPPWSVHGLLGLALEESHAHTTSTAPVIAVDQPIFIVGRSMAVAAGR